jgi:hypothetical protein
MVIPWHAYAGTKGKQRYSAYQFATQDQEEESG